ncbi:MAG TPA: glycoside hydrolase family 57 protein [Vicinamibacterales bacterium]
MTRVAILWHMHQPFYQDLVTGEHILPWVRLHAIKDYYGMVALLREFPEVKVTFNLVPSLLVQLEAFAQDRAHDRTLELSLKPAANLTASDVDFMRANFFHAQRQRMIDVHPRYAELLDGRAGTYTVDDLRDLQVWHKLAWIDPLYLDSDPRVRSLVERDRGFTEADKTTLRQVELEILNRVVPEYRDAAARGQIEISASPFYHPILPLLCDTNIYLRTHPDARRLRHPFVHPEDAALQLTRAAEYVGELFGHRPSGLWPSEGSVSEAIVPLAVQAGFHWMATDELILARSLGLTFSRDGAGHLEQPERLYAPYLVQVGDTTIASAFRDHVLSDLIGFTYSSWDAEAAANDFASRLAEAGRRFSRKTGGEEAFIAIILDGENAWEHFERGGRPFLRAVYKRLATHPELKTVTVSEGCEGASRRLRQLFPGSWIDGNFYIWIGHADDQKAWNQLADARTALDQAEIDGHAPDLPGAREEILIAEGSDWCWWYGDDHSSGHDAEFDELYRRHLRNAYSLMGQPTPDDLFMTNISSARGSAQSEPAALLKPTIDGEETSYFEWLGAGVYEVQDVAGAMHQTSRAAVRLASVRFGFDRQRLFVRVDGRQPMAELLRDGYEVALKFLDPAGRRFSVRSVAGDVSGVHWERVGAPPRWRPIGPGNSAVGCGRILELGIPLVDLSSGAQPTVSFFVAVYDRDSVEQERHPAHRPVEITLADDAFEARHWRA